jgi:hypothetical protein
MMQVSRVINASQIKVWEILIDTQLWPVWGPSVHKVESPKRYLDIGLRGRVKTAALIWVNFEITAFVTQQYWHWKIAGIPATGHRLYSLDENRSVLVFELPVIAFPYALICKKALQRIDRLASKQNDFTETIVHGKMMNAIPNEQKPSSGLRGAPDHLEVGVGPFIRSIK